MTTQDEDTRDLRRLYAGLAMMGDWSVATINEGREAEFTVERLKLRARLYWRMADAMLATEDVQP